MCDCFALTRLDDAILEALMLRLTSDRNAGVSQHLPDVLKAILERGKGDTHDSQTVREHQHQQRQRGDRRDNSVRAASLTRLLDCADCSGPDTARWLVWARDLGDSMKGLVAGKQQTALKEIADNFKEALEPLLSLLLSAQENGDEAGEEDVKRVGRYKAFYSSAISHTLHAYLSCFGETEQILWLKRCMWRDELRNLLLPFVREEVEPLEKELVYHFQDGRSTARRVEAQHFFSFLVQLYTRFLGNLGTHGWVTSGVAEREGIGTLTTLGSVALASTAVSVFRATYGWRDDSDYLLERDFVVHTVNCIIDFLSMSSGVVHRIAQSLISECLLVPVVFRDYLDTARATIDRAFATGPEVLWRRQFLADTTWCTVPSTAFGLAQGTCHMLRCLEAILRRLMIVFGLLPASASLAWNHTVAPSLEMFVLSIEDAKEKASFGESNVEAITASVELLDAVEAVCRLGEEWRDCLSKFCEAKDMVLTPLEKIACQRDAIRHDVAQSTSEFLRCVLDPTEVSALSLHKLDGILTYATLGPQNAKNILYGAITSSVLSITTAGERANLRECCVLTGMEAVASLLKEAMP
uniref:Uncharacterized protein n=1 Tax=Trypanosoma congolense (strain IL3000) TaxID=1068625 RepID=G0UN22_TRYCI|nr:conserved hypothetical protein [Trypanosoma congolense IL3000]